MRVLLILAPLAGCWLLAGCRTNGRPFSEIEAEAAAHPVQLSVGVEQLGEVTEPPSQEKLVGKWESNYQSDILDFRPSLPSPIVSVLHFRDVLTLHADGTYRNQLFQGGKQTVDTDGLWKYEEGLLTLDIKGKMRRQYSTIWHGENVWEERWYPESGIVDWWQAFYESRNQGYVCETIGGYRPDGCLRLIHKQRRVGGSGYIVDSIETPKAYKRVSEGGTK